MIYKKLGDYIQQVNNRNRDLQVETLLGVSITKKLIPSIANTVGTDMSVYKIIEKGQFAYGTITSRNGDKISIALADEHEKALVSQIYIVFEVIDDNKILPEYLMMWFSRPEFDRYARYRSHGSTRESFDWEELCEVELPIPSIEKQCEIVAQYQAVENKIKVNEQICEKLEATAQVLYKQWFVDFEFPITKESHPELVEGYKSSGGKMVWNEELEKEIPEGWEVKSLGEVTTLITDGKHGNSEDEYNSGYYFISAKDINNEIIDYNNARQITYKDFEETHRRTNLKTGDTLITNSGTIGKLAYIFDNEINSFTTFQKSVAILKPTLDSKFFFQTIKYCISDLIDLSGGSTQSNLLLGDLKIFKVLIPRYNVIKDYSKKIDGVISQSYILKIQNQKLTQLQSLLLSRLATLEEVKLTHKKN